MLTLYVRSLLGATLVVTLVKPQMTTSFLLMFANPSVVENAQPLTIRKLASAAIRHVGEHLFDSGPRAGTWSRTFRLKLVLSFSFARSTALFSSAVWLGTMSRRCFSTHRRQWGHEAKHFRRPHVIFQLLIQGGFSPTPETSLLRVCCDMCIQSCLSALKICCVVTYLCPAGGGRNNTANIC